MPDTLNAVIRHTAAHLLDRHPGTTPDEIFDHAWANHRDVMTGESERLIRNAGIRIAKEVMRNLSSDDQDGQQRLPGVDLPSAIAVPIADGYVYVRSDKATLAQLDAGRTVRVGNVEAAAAALDRYDRAIERLRPHFAGTAATTREAWEAWRAATQTSAA